MHVEGRGHLCETISVSHHMGSRDQNLLISLIGKHLCLLSYLLVPKINTLIGKHSGPKDELRVKHMLNTRKAPSSSLSTEKTKQQTNKQTKIFSPNYTRQPKAFPRSSETSSTRGTESLKIVPFWAAFLSLTCTWNSMHCSHTRCCSLADF